MPNQPPVAEPIQVTEVFVRLYVLLAQYLDRCLNESGADHIPLSELETHLAETRERLLEHIETNRVVRQKIEQEYERLHGLGAACLGGSAVQTAMEQVKKEREMLQIKMKTLSDLLAVFRSE